MSKTKISEFSTTPGNNTDINGINIAEGCAPSGINNAIRELMSDLKEWQSGAMDVYVIPQGTIASPGLQLYGDLDTGFYGDAANQLGVAVGGSSVGYFSASGWVGNVVAQTIDLVNIEVTNIKAKDGTASIALADSTGVATFSKPTVMSVDSASDALRITQIGAGNALLVEDSANPDTSPFVVTAAGLVGVGTLNPTRTIHVSAASGLPGITLESTSNGSSSNGVVLFNRTTTSASVSQTIGSALWSHNLTDSTSVTAASIIVTGNNTAGSNTANMAIDAKTSTIMKVNGTEVANFASGGLNVTGTVDVTSIETTNIKAKDGTAAASIADSTGVMTIASSVLTTTDINGGTIDGAVIGGSSAAAGTFTTITGTQVNSDNLRLDGNTLSSTDTNGNITIAPNGTGQVVMSGDLDVANIETGAIKARDGTAGATIANSTGQFTFNANIKRGVLELGQPTGLNVAMIKATNTNGPVFIQANGTGPIFLYADETTLVPNGTTAKLTTDSGCDLVLDTNGGSDSGSITIQDGVNGNIVIAPNGTGQVQLSGALDVTDIEVTNIKAKDGTAALSIADSTGAVTVATALTANGGAVFNENGADVDFRVEGDTDANLIFADASTDRVGIGTSTITSRLQVKSNSTGGIFVNESTDATATYGYLSLSHYTNGAFISTYAGSNADADKLRLGTGGTEKLRITSGGQVNIGGNFTSTNNTLQVTGNAAIGYTTAAPTTGLIVAGNVGVGTNNPAYRLDVSGQARALEGGTGSGDGGLISATAAQNGNAGVLFQTNSASRWNLTTQGTNGANLRLYNYALASAVATFDSSGNLGLGATSPRGLLDLNTTRGVKVYFGTAGTLGETQQNAGDYVANNLFVSAESAGTITYTKTTGDSGNAIIQDFSRGITFYTGVTGAATTTGTLNNFERMRLDSSGNLGLGVTPSAWESGWPALQVGTGAAVWSTSDGRTSLGSNIFVGSGPTAKYIGNGFASSYTQLNGVHSWNIAPNNTSGAGAALTATQAMTLDASGNLVIGDTSASYRLDVKGSTGNGIAYRDGTVTNYLGTTGSNLGYLGTLTNHPVAFLTNATEKARITSGGYFKASNNGSYLNSTGSFHEFNQSTNVETLVARNTFATFTENVLYVQADRNTTNNSFYAITYYNAGAAASKFRVADSGDVTNTNGTYGTISDAKMKTDIVDAGSQWSDIKALRFRKFKMKDDPSGLVQLGVVAQEVEQTSPGLVDEHADKDAEGNDLGTTTKSVKTSVLLMKAAVALQEAMARIEKLEAEVAALKGV